MLSSFIMVWMSDDAFLEMQTLFGKRLCVYQVLLGLGYSLYTTTAWPMVSYVVPLSRLGTAFGMYVILYISFQPLESSDLSLIKSNVYLFIACFCYS